MTFPPPPLLYKEEARNIRGVVLCSLSCILVCILIAVATLLIFVYVPLMSLHGTRACHSDEAWRYTTCSILYLSKKEDNNLNIMVRRYLVDKLIVENYKLLKLSSRVTTWLGRATWSHHGTCQAPKSTQSEAWKEWKIKDKRAKLEILLHVEDMQVDAVRKITTTTKMWSKLK